MAPATVPQAVQPCHEVLRWVIPQLDKWACLLTIPRTKRVRGFCRLYDEVTCTPYTNLAQSHCL